MSAAEIAAELDRIEAGLRKLGDRLGIPLDPNWDPEDEEESEL